MKATISSKLCLLALTAMVAVAGGTARADEGMWLLGRMDQRTMDVARSLGLELTEQELYNDEGTALNACVVDFGDYCSGVIVSPDGLLFTNHHCGFSSIQQLSTPDDDILANGFVARSREEERPVDGLFVKIWLRCEDVTAQVLAELDSVYANPELGRKAGKQRQAVLYNDYVGSIMDKIAMRAQRRANEERKEGIVCEVKAFEGGRSYLLNYYRQYDDIRLVFTVPQSLGKFGGDTDNWMWPRQTADFSVFRIYADSLGLPADYSADNVPLRPRRYARISLEGYTQGSYCMTIGYPGSTSRYLSSYGVEERVDVANIPRIRVRGVKQDVWRRWMTADRTVGIKYASKYASSSNYWKNSQGMNEAVARLGIVAEKEAREQELRRWFAATPALRARFAQMLPQLKKDYRTRRDARYAQGFVSEALYGTELITFGRLAARVADMHPDRRRGITEYVRDLYKDYDPRVDEDVMAALLEEYAREVPSRYLPRFYKDIRRLFKGDYKAFAHEIFEGTRLTSFEGWQTLVDAEVSAEGTYDDALEQKLADEEAYRDHVGSDPAVILAEEVGAMVAAVIQPVLERTGASISWNEALLTQAVMEKEMDQPHYSDANFTQRMSIGIVSDYTNSGTHHDYITTLPSLLDKIDHGADNPDYVVEEAVAALLRTASYGRYADQRTGQLPLCFLTTNDITGGNSGSPMFNGRGELIGLAFDGNWDALSSDISFDASLTRCIGVDIRFVLWLMDRWGHADRLISELLP